MAERHSNLLLSADEAPEAGIQYGTVCAWYGGPLNVSISGAADGATFDLLACNRLPTLAEGETYGDVLTDADWAVVAEGIDGVYAMENLNPCLLGVRVNTPGDETAIRIIIG